MASNQIDLTLQEDSLRSRSSSKKNRSYYKSKRRRRQGSQSSVDRSPATKRSPISPCAPKEFLNGHVSYQDGINGDLSNDEIDDVVTDNGAMSPPRTIPGVSRSAPHSSDSGPHPASSCESDVEHKNDSIPNTWDGNNLPSYNNNTNISKRTGTNQNEQCSTDSSEENNGEISDLEEDISCNLRYNPFESIEDEDEHLRRIIEQTVGSTLEHYEVSIYIAGFN